MRNKNTKKINKVMKGLGTNLKIAPMSCCTLFYVHFFLLSLSDRCWCWWWWCDDVNRRMFCLFACPGLWRGTSKNVTKSRSAPDHDGHEQTDGEWNPSWWLFFLFGSVVFVSVFCCVCKCTCLPLTSLHLCNSVRGIGWCHWQRIWFIFMN